MKGISICRGRFLFILATALALATGAAAVRADEEKDFAALSREMKKAYDAANYDKALEVALKMHEMREGDVRVLYNIACLHCLKGEKPKAYDWLEKAAGAGYRDADYLLNDYDFRTIRGEPRFRNLIRRIRDQSPAGGDAKSPKPDGDEKGAAKGSDEPAEAGTADPKKPDKPDKPKAPDVPKMAPQERFEKITELTGKLIELAGKKQHDRALEAALEARAQAKALYDELKDNERDGPRAKGQFALTEYNTACMYALMKNKDQALDHLEACLDLGGLGGNTVAQFERDSDLDHLRGEDRFKKLLARAKDLPAQERPQDAPPEPKSEKVEFQWKATLPEGHDASKRAPLVVVLHHYQGSLERETQRWKKAVGEAGAILLTPQGTYKLGDGQYEWGKDLDEIEENVMRAVNKVMDQHKVDQGKIVLAGFSQGGWATWGLALRNPDAFCGIIPVCGAFNPESDKLFESEDLGRLRVFIMLGEEESFWTKSANRRAAERFKAAGAKVSLNTYEGVAHGYPKNESEEQLKALRFVLGE